MDIKLPPDNIENMKSKVVKDRAMYKIIHKKKPRKLLNSMCDLLVINDSLPLKYLLANLVIC